MEIKRLVDDDGNLVRHQKCGLPIKLCVCGGKGDPHAVSRVRCLECGKKWVAVYPPGVPLSEIECSCGSRGVE